MMTNYSLSKIGVNFSVNANDPEQKTQMKARMVEVPASNSLLVTEYTPGIEEFFEINKEIICFKEEKEMIEKIKYLLNNDSVRNKIAEAGYRRFLKDHESKVRLKNILERVNSL
jgi:spore maturation protein CgeB